MAWTPESIAELLSEQLRQAALLRQQLATERARKERLVAWWRRLWTDPIRNLFAIVTASSFTLALVLLALSWPPGGGQELSSLAIAQGSSLIFVVLLMSLLAGPLAASRELPTGPAWLTKDWRFWTGFGLVGALSLVELWLGWARADRKEELATLALTTSGLGLTALLARELLHLSDPRALVLRQVKDALVKLDQAVREGRARSTSALAASGVDPRVVQQVVQYADPVAREVATAHIREFLAAAKAACQRADASLAATAHAAATVIALQYIESSESLSTQDAALWVYSQESDDLHEMAGGGALRALSSVIVDDSGRVAARIAKARSTVSVDARNPAALTFIRGLEGIVSRRLSDERSEDPARAMRAMGTAALVGCEAGYVWFAVEVNERLLGLATATTNIQHSTGRQMAHVALPAWEESLKVLVALARNPRVAGQPMPFEAATKDFGQSLESIGKLPRFNILLPLDPILRAASASGDPTLQAAFYTFWAASKSVQNHLPQFGRSICWRLTTLLSKTDDDAARHSWSDLVADVLYQWVAAATTYAGDGERRLLKVESIANTLGWMRSLLVKDDEVQSNHNLLPILHAYISGWELCLYTARGLAQLPESAGGELDHFLEALTDEVVAEMPPVLPDGIHLLGRWLDRAGYHDASQRVEQRGQVMETVSEWNGPPSWDPLGGPEFYTRRGGLIPAVVRAVEQYFQEPVARPAGSHDPRHLSY